MANLKQDFTHFGFKEVSKSQKSQLVRNVFDSVANRYDLMNDLMSLGVHRLWKDALVDWLNPRKEQTLLDVAGGTGDITNRFKKRGGGRAIICDINQEMLRSGQKKFADSIPMRDTLWICGDAENLPVEDKSIDIYTIAFGLRNVTNIQVALEEAYRVLRPGGRFLCLEFSSVVITALKPLYEAYSFKIIPQIGKLVANDKESYKYLVESIKKFPDQHQLSFQIRETGLERCKFRNLSGGIAAIHSAWRL